MVEVSAFDAGVTSSNPARPSDRAGFIVCQDTMPEASRCKNSARNAKPKPSDLLVVIAGYAQMRAPQIRAQLTLRRLLQPVQRGTRPTENARKEMSQSGTQLTLSARRKTTPHGPKQIQKKNVFTRKTAAHASWKTAVIYRPILPKSYSSCNVENACAAVSRLEIITTLITICRWRLVVPMKTGTCSFCASDATIRNTQNTQ